MTQPTTTTLLADLDRARRRLYALLRAQDPRALSKHPPSGAWSIIENVRHLVFAEQKHLGDFLPDGAAWNPMKMRPTSRRTIAGKGGDVIFRYRERQLIAEYAAAEPDDDLEKVLRSWDLIHQPIRKALQTRGAEAQGALTGHIQHLQSHIEMIETLLPPA